MKLILILLLVLNNSILFAQYRRSIRVKAGEDIGQAYSPHGFYRFPQFCKATIYFKGGGKNESQFLNYNFIAGSMQFIGPKGDTLDIGEAARIDSVRFEKNSFLHNNGFMEIAANADSLRLLKKLVIKTQVEDIGAYGIPTQTASIDKIKSHAFGSNVYSFRLNQDVMVIESIFWFFADEKNTLVKATKSNLMKLLPSSLQSKAEWYIRENKTSFEKEDDLVRLISYISK